MRKKIVLFSTVFLLCISGILANEKKVDSKITHVTVFPNSAQVTRSGSFSIQPGMSQIIFENVSPYLNQSGIQAKGKGNFTILDVKFRTKQPEIVLPTSNELPPKIINEIELLRDSIVFLNFDLTKVQDNIYSLELEKQILLNNQLVKGHGGDTITELKATMEYFRTKISDINDRIITHKQDQFKLNKKLTRMNKRLTELEAYNQQQNPLPKDNKIIYQIIVTINADYAVNGSIDVSYTVTNAGWLPTYDLKTSGIENPVQLIYKANVWQNTGEEWNKANLKLSTITPSANNVKPVLPIFYLNYYNYNVVQTTSSSSKRESRTMAGAPSAAEEMDLDDANYAYNYTYVAQTMTNVEFDIKIPYTVPSDGQYHIIPIQNETISTKYVYHIVPKIETQAFLIAKLTDWQKLDLLPGQANIYFDGTFVGETQINPSTLSDTLELALGRDRSLQIQRKQTINKTEKKLVGTIVTKQIGFEITIKNTKMANVDIVVQDNIPISTNDEIKVKVLNDGKSNYSESSGILTWFNPLKAGETKKLSFSYEIEYDSAKPINGNF